MLMRFLHDEDKMYLLELAMLLALSDKPLLWDGKPSDELTSSTNLDALSIQEGELERELIADLQISAGISQSGRHNCEVILNLTRKFLLEILKTYPISKVEKPEARAQAAITVLKQILKRKQYKLQTAPRVILFELMLVALRDGNISGIEWALLKEYQLHHQLDDFIFDDLLERAGALNQEVSKTIAIILE